MRIWSTGLCAGAALLALNGMAAADIVKVGVIGVFSGGFARWGEQFKQAIEVYQKHNGDSVNGHKIEILYRDAGGPDPAKARQLAEELILREKVQFLAGFAFTPNALVGRAADHRGKGADGDLQRRDSVSDARAHPISCASASRCRRTRRRWPNGRPRTASRKWSRWFPTTRPATMRRYNF